MKKILSVFAIAALFVAAAVSCSKEINDPEDNENTQEEEVVAPEEPEQPGDEDDTPVPEGMIRLRFAVSHEGDAEAEDDEAKTSWDGTTHAWSDGDQIRILWGEGANDYVDATVSGGIVSAVVADADSYYAVYPTTATYALDANEGKVTVSFVREQSGAFADANIMAAKTSRADASFSFKNMTSILKFSTGLSSTYTKVTFCANDKTKLNGDVSTTFDDSYTNASTGTNRDLLSVSVTAGNTYYLAVLPDITLSNGIGFKVEASNQDTGALSTRSLTMSRTGVMDLGTIDNMIRKDWFIKEGGTGKGTSWEDAGGAERLVQLIYPDQSRGDGAGLTAAYRLHKATIHVASGTYNIQAANGDEVLSPHYNTGALNFTIKGGYPTNLSGTATTGQDPENNKTNFICNQSVSTDRVFLLSGSNKIPNVTFDGITFPANGPSLAPGTAFDFNSSASSNVNFKNCYFTGFVQSGTVNGGPVYVQNTGAATINFTGCTFSGNTCNTGGAAYLYNDNAAISFTDCSFGNNSSGSHGGALRARGFSSLTITRGSFASNSATNSGVKGGAIYVDGGSTLTIDGTTFDGNIGGTWGVASPSGRGGAILIVSSAEVEIKNAVFQNNKSSNGGAVHTEDGSNVFINNSTFKKNEATNGASIRTAGVDGKLAKLIVFNSLFLTNTVTGTGNQGGFDVQATTNYSRVLIANSTFRALTGNAALGTNGAPNFNVVSCTFNENTADFNRNFNNGKFYNSILASGNPSVGTNLQKAQYYSIYGDYRYGAGGTTTALETSNGLAASCLQSFATDHYPLNSAASTSYGEGMSAADIQALSFSDITLTQDQLDLLAKDQKGNDRSGTIMGAYVLTQ